MVEEIQLARVDEIFSGSHNDLSNVGSSDHHSKYTDSEAISAVDGEVTNSGTVSGLDSDFDSHTGGGNPHGTSLEDARQADSAIDGPFQTDLTGLSTHLNVAGLYDGNVSDGVVVVTINNTPNRMIDAEISIQGYDGVSKYHIRGYTHLSDSDWHNPKATVVSSGHNQPVRFAVNSSGDRVILFGETSTDWGNHLHASVNRVSVGYNSDDIGDWDISVTTDISGYSGIQSVALNDGFTATDPDFSGNVTVGGTVDGVNVASLESNFSSHESNTSNPHSVGLDQARVEFGSFGGDVGLGANKLLNVGQIEFSNIEDVSDGEIGRDNSIGFLASWGGNGTAVLWDSYNVNEGNAISISGGKGAESNPTIAVNESGISHGNLAGIGSSDHHTKYTDSEAVSAVDAEVTNSGTVSGLDSDFNNHTGSSSAHHSKYTDSEAVSAVDGEVSAAASTVSGLDSTVNTHQGSTSNPHNVGLEQARSQNNILTGDVDLSSNDLTRVSTVWGGTTGDFVSPYIEFGTNLGLGGGDVNVDNNLTIGGTVDGVNVSSLESDFSSHQSANSAHGSNGDVAGLNDVFSGSHNDLSNVGASDHHAKYTDAEAVSAADGEVSATSTTLSGFDSTVNTHIGNSSAHHSKTQTTDIDSSNWNDYEIQKDGTDGNGIINFKTS